MGANTALPNDTGWPTRLRIEAARRELASLCDSAHQLRLAGLDSASVELLRSRKRAELNSLMKHHDQLPISATVDCGS